MAKEGSNVVWNVTVDNPRLMELLGIFVGEKTMKLVQSLDPSFAAKACVGPARWFSIQS